MAAMVAVCSAVGDAAAAAAAATKAHRAASGLLHSAARLARAAAQLIEDEAMGAGQPGRRINTGNKKPVGKYVEKEPVAKNVKEKKKLDQEHVEAPAPDATGPAPERAPLRRKRRPRPKGAVAPMQPPAAVPAAWYPVAVPVNQSMGTVGQVCEVGKVSAGDVVGAHSGETAFALQSTVPLCEVDESSFYPDQRVCIHGMVARAEYNGKAGTVVQWNDDKQSWRVRMNDGTCELFPGKNMRAAFAHDCQASEVCFDPLVMLRGMAEEVTYQCSWTGHDTAVLDPFVMLGGMCEEEE